MAQTLFTLSIIAFALAGASFILSVFFWIFFEIPTVIGDLSGRTARKSIAKKRAANEKSGVKYFKESSTNAERGKLTGTMPDSEPLKRKKKVQNEEEPETGLLKANLANDIETEATGLLIDEEATAPLELDVQKPIKRTCSKKLVMIEEIILIHTEEVID